VGYATVMTPVDLVALGASMGMLYWYYRRDLPARVAVEALPDPAQAVRDPRLFRAARWVLALLLVGYIVSQRLGWPVSIFSAAAAVALLGLAWRSPAVSVRGVLRQAPWHIVTFSVGMYVVVFGLRRTGLLALLSQVLWLSYRAGPVAAVVGSGALAALLSATMNNLPAVMMEALAIATTSVPPSIRHLMAYANVVGCDLGPRLTPIGSLATLLWLHVLERRGLRISWGYLWKAGMVLTPPTLLAALLGLAVWSSWLR
jgi:arsenical pump membrane protein